MLGVPLVTNHRWPDKNAPIFQRARSHHRSDRWCDSQMYSIRLHAIRELDPVVDLVKSTKSTKLTNIKLNRNFLQSRQIYLPHVRGSQLISGPYLNWYIIMRMCWIKIKIKLIRIKSIEMRQNFKLKLLQCRAFRSFWLTNWLDHRLPSILLVEIQRWHSPWSNGIALLSLTRMLLALAMPSGERVR